MCMRNCWTGECLCWMVLFQCVCGTAGQAAEEDEPRSVASRFLCSGLPVFWWRYGGRCVREKHSPAQCTVWRKLQDLGQCKYQANQNRRGHVFQMQRWCGLADCSLLGLSGRAWKNTSINELTSPDVEIYTKWRLSHNSERFCNDLNFCKYLSACIYFWNEISYSFKS